MTERAMNAVLAGKLSAATDLDVRTTETGGGCTALMATLHDSWLDPDAPHLLITAGLDPSFPLDERGVYHWGVFVGAYPGGANDEGDDLLSIDEADTYPAEASAAAIAEATERTTHRIIAALTRWQVAQSAAVVSTDLADRVAEALDAAVEAAEESCEDIRETPGYYDDSDREDAAEWLTKMEATREAFSELRPNPAAALVAGE